MHGLAHIHTPGAALCAAQFKERFGVHAAALVVAAPAGQDEVRQDVGAAFDLRDNVIFCGGVLGVTLPSLDLDDGNPAFTPEANAMVTFHQGAEALPSLEPI
ncbi:hypothetical protein BA190_09575 [Labrys sp. WJW]|nr:hypothetical protein BA190_09575 [Labrys sp. WJW]